MSKVIGIDLGSTFSAVSIMEGNEPKLLTNQEGQRTTASVVSYGKDGEVSVGQSAVRQAVINPDSTIYLAKRFIGRRFNEVEEDAKLMPYKVVRGDNDLAYFEVKGKKVSPQEVGAKILQKLKQSAEQYLGEEVNEAVITVPAYFNDAQRQATKEAGEIIGLKVLRVISEPTAAALAYGFGAGKNKGEQTIAVYDFGGGTFDISVLEVGENVVEVLATNGNSRLGGHDINNRLVAYILSEFKKSEGLDVSKDKMVLQRVNEAVEKAKIELSSVSETDINLPFLTADATGPKHLNLKLSRATLEKLVLDLVESSLEPCRKALQDAGKTTAEIDDVLLVGGQTRMPLIVESVKKFFGKEPNRSVNPDEVVSLGSAIQGSILKGEVKDLLLLDVLPLSLGIETAGGVMTTLISRNTTIPTKKAETFSTYSDNQLSVEVHILQGERPMASQNRTLGRFNLDGIPPAPRGTPQIEIQLDVDANGILNVSAKDKATGRAQNITISNGSGLSKEEIQRMADEAKEHEAEDKRKREEVEERNKADTLAYQVEKSLNDNKDKVSQSTADNVSAKLSDLKEALSKNEGVKEATEALTKASHALAEELYKNVSAQPEPEPQKENGEGKVVDAVFEE